jgi:hypothetical protein
MRVNVTFTAWSPTAVYITRFSKYPEIQYGVVATVTVGIIPRVYESTLRCCRVSERQTGCQYLSFKAHAVAYLAQHQAGNLLYLQAGN